MGHPRVPAFKRRELNKLEVYNLVTTFPSLSIVRRPERAGTRRILLRQYYGDPEQMFAQDAAHDTFINIPRSAPHEVAPASLFPPIGPDDHLAS